MMDEGKRKIRSHVTGTAVVAGLFFTALLIVVLSSRQDPPSPVGPSPSATPQAATQETLLVQVTLARVRTASLLTAVGSDPDRTVMVSLPSDMLLVDGPAYTPLLDANLSLNRRLTVQATANTLGVRVDGGWRMERKALAGLVDAVGGVKVTLPAPTVFLDEAGVPILELPAGESTLSGPDASWYVMGVVPNEDAIAGIQARFAEVFAKTVVKLPENPDSVRAILTSLGALSDPLNGTSDVAQYLVAMRGDLLAEQVLTTTLPFRSSSAADPVVTRNELQGGTQPVVGAFRVTDYIVATPTLREIFAASPRIAEVDGPPRVLVWNASGEPRATQVALLELTDADFVALSGGSWDSVEPMSRIDGVGYAANGVSYSSGVAEALRLPSAEMFGETGTLSPIPVPTVSASTAATMPPPDRIPRADVDVVFGQDYQPCPADEPNCLLEVQ